MITPPAPDRTPLCGARTCAPTAAHASARTSLDGIFGPLPAAAAPPDDVAGTLASAFALLPDGADLAVEPAGPGGECLSPFSASPFLPLSGAALARAASVPGTQGELACNRALLCLDADLAP